MFWILLLVLSVVLAIVGIVLMTMGSELMSMLLISTGIVGILLLGITIPGTIMEYNTDIQTFKNQKQYIESVKSDNPVEDAALTQKKIEYNDWLFTKQNFYKNYHFFTLMPSEILYLEPIQ